MPPDMGAAAGVGRLAETVAAGVERATGARTVKVERFWPQQLIMDPLSRRR
jgi:hypothetical protein